MLRTCCCLRRRLQHHPAGHLAWLLLWLLQQQTCCMWAHLWHLHQMQEDLTCCRLRAPLLLLLLPMLPH